MTIELEKVSNARDLGGIKTSYGTVKYNRLIRSGHLSIATEQDVAVLKNHGLQRIIDLRTSAEIANHPNVPIEGVSTVNISIMNSTTFGISFETLDGKQIALKLQAGIERMLARGETPIEHMRILYKKFVHDPASLEGYGRFIKTLANNAVEGATLWHCTVGKDRCGTCTALLLYCLGASREEILRDYLLTNVQTESRSNSILNKVRPFVDDDKMALVTSMLTVDESYIDCFLSEATAQYGSLDKFLDACRVTPEDKQNLRNIYLDR